ncbi:hypothetical protein PILCRDRAFT_810215 [Piloderma croceum F 1598]|uniref:Uncharacterized protein n=1 Tax=Piloderma croceum (strain F 1598) TaxID=765440 RepID=A0A0C3CRC2_PILCF|nr:hypothetical protein PILCRDRAFT_810215 [Piloderma croceum F 1598]
MDELTEWSANKKNESRGVVDLGSGNPVGLGRSCSCNFDPPGKKPPELTAFPCQRTAFVMSVWYSSPSSYVLNVFYPLKPSQTIHITFHFY